MIEFCTGNFITATIVDAASFAVVYGKEGNVLGVKRLNSVTHKPSDETERERAAWWNYYVLGSDGYLALSRAIGDNTRDLKKHCVCSEASIDLVNIEDLGIALAAILLRNSGRGVCFNSGL